MLQKAEGLRDWVEMAVNDLLGDSDAFMQVIFPNHLDCGPNSLPLEDGRFAPIICFGHDFR